jgi:hypothetical protein
MWKLKTVANGITGYTSLGSLKHLHIIQEKLMMDSTFGLNNCDVGVLLHSFLVLATYCKLYSDRSP